MPQKRKRVAIVGLPRCGTTLLATFLNAQPQCTFVTDYVPGFHEAMTRLGLGWSQVLNEAQRRVALALIRDQFLRLRHIVNVQVHQFSSMDDLHRLVLNDVARAHDVVVGHKLMLHSRDLRPLVFDTEIHSIVLYRDPRDAALSFWHRTGGGVETFLAEWKAMVRTLHEMGQHERLTVLRYESLVTSPEATLEDLQNKLGIHFVFDANRFTFRRSLRVKEDVAWKDNSAFHDVSRLFDDSPIARWRTYADSPIVRYAGCICRKEIGLLGYEPANPDVRLAIPAWTRARANAIELAAYRATASLSKRLLRPLTPNPTPTESPTR